MTMLLQADATIHAADPSMTQVLGDQLLSQCSAMCDPHLRHCVPKLIDVMLDAHRWRIEHRATHVRHVLEDACAAFSEGDMQASRVEYIDRMVLTVVEQLELIRREHQRVIRPEPSMSASYWVG